MLPLLAIIVATPASGQSPHWTDQQVLELQAIVDGIGHDGLAPEDYARERLREVGTTDSAERDDLASLSALLLARDLWQGTPAFGGDWRNWHIERPKTDYHAWLATALANGSMLTAFQALRPRNAAYIQLSNALGTCEPHDCETIRVNMDRWRRLPRDLGPRYLWVNAAAFRLDVVQWGTVIRSHKVIVGKEGSPTPVFKASVTGVTANPWWNVPCSIVDEGIGKLVQTRPEEAARRGYVATRGRDGKLVVRQKPGPANALGRVKLEMPNPYNVYIHDTPHRDLFEQDSRALSHGCVRTSEPEALAQAVLGADQGASIDALIASGKTVTIQVRPPIPVYVVYFTAEPDDEVPGGVRFLPDIYHRDGLDR